MMDDQALAALRERAHETLSELTAEVCAEGGVDPREVYEITVCGNVTMMHLALGIDPEPLSMAPFVVSDALAAAGRRQRVRGRRSIRARPAFVFPSLGAYVGGDIVAGMLATGLTRDRRLRLFIDVGTNSEIALGSSDRVLATAAPAGPAFEAAQIRCGMRAADGAIEGIKIDGDSLELEVIGDAEPAGMCGSGLVDAVSELVQLRPARPLRAVHPRRGRRRAAPRARAAADDDRQGARVRAALARRAGVRIRSRRCSCPSATCASSSSQRRRSPPAGRSCCASSGSSPDDITQVLLAGSFGSYLTPLSAVRIGLVPKLALPRIVSAGNVAGEGAKIAALSLRERAEAHSILREVEYVELSGRADFNDLFIDQLAFPG